MGKRIGALTLALALGTSGCERSQPSAPALAGSVMAARQASAAKAAGTLAERKNTLATTGSVSGGAASGDVPDAALGLRLWSFSQCLVHRADGQDLAVSLQVQKSPVTGAIEGHVFATQSFPRNLSFMGEVTGGTITHAPAGGGTAHISGVLAEGVPFTIDLVDANDAATPDRVDFEVPGEISFPGELEWGDVRIARSLPVGINFALTPGAAYDYQLGLYLFAADEANLTVGPQGPVPDLALQSVMPDPIELPNGALPGNLNAVPGIGFDVPTFVNDRPVFPDGVPVFPNDHPTLLN